MADHDRMLDDAGAAGRGLIPFRGGFITLDDLMATAIKLQDSATEAKAHGEHDKAVELYQELLPHVQLLDALDAFHQPEGLATQLVERAIEIERYGLPAACRP